MSRVLGIETSCDETGVAVVSGGVHIVAQHVASQVEDHAVFGGVVPEIASRRHTECIHQLTAKTLAEAGEGVEVVAATNGPGLMGSLLVGVNFGKALAYSWDVPYVPVHHLEGHIFSVFLSENRPDFPFLALIVSGGHTCLIDCPAPHRYIVLGTTRDDAVGESFDKVARLLDLPYPGGPSIQEAAEAGDPKAVDFPRAMNQGDSLDFSYSGLKTAVLYETRAVCHDTADVAASFQHAAIQQVITKTKAALTRTRARTLVVAGGVAANALLRKRASRELDAAVYIPPLHLCLDNGAMIAAAGYSRWLHGYTGGLDSTADPALALTG